MAKEETTTAELINFWFHQFDAVHRAAVGRTGEDVADAMLTVATSRMLEKYDHDTVAARLAMIAGAMHALGQQQQANAAPPSSALN